MYERADRVRVSGTLKNMSVDMYFTPDSMAMVFPQSSQGIKMSIDSAKTLFSENTPDSLLQAIPT